MEGSGELLFPGSMAGGDAEALSSQGARVGGLGGSGSGATGGGVTVPAGVGALCSMQAVSFSS